MHMIMKQQKADVMKYIKEYDLYDEAIDDPDGVYVRRRYSRRILEDVFDDFTEERGIGHYGYEKLSQRLVRTFVKSLMILVKIDRNT